jgi:histidyl-tRNA synthetase
MFRHERPQKGRQRQFHQIDTEIIGAMEPEIDAELMAMGQLLLTELGLEASLEINSLGCPQCRPGFRTALIEYLNRQRDGLCEDCKRRIDTNPLRALDCKNKQCRTLVQEAPSILENLCPDCENHFSAVRQQLDTLNISYTLNHFMVRGLDYYTRTTFEFLTDKLGAQAAVAAGGRYDGLIEQLGGPKNMPGIGFAMGMERLALLMQHQETASATAGADIFVAALGERAIAYAAPLVHQLRKLGLHAAMEYSNRKLKAQMKQAGRVNARFTLIIGDQELENREAVLRNMESREQEAFSLEGTVQELGEQLIKHTATK